MVNSKEFALRLKKIMEFNEISATVLSQKIGVQRSNISHILSERNKPSLEFVMKIIKAFPEVELYWLLNGTGHYPKKDQKHAPPTPSDQNQISVSTDGLFHDTDKSNENDRRIERIVVFYEDGSFQSYDPK